MCTTINIKHITGVDENHLIDDFGSLRDWLRSRLTMTIPMNQANHNSNDFEDDACLCPVNIPKLGSLFRYTVVRTLDMEYIFFKSLDRAMIWMTEEKNIDMLWGFYTESGEWFERDSRKDIK